MTQPVRAKARRHRDMIVIGGSAGGVAALQEVVARLPRELPAAVLIVVHVPAWYPSALPRILSRAGPLPASHARDGEEIGCGRIYVAPPDHHLLIDDGRLHLTRGARENHNRPAIDPLFRSAAEAFGRRVIGVVLSGLLGDGTGGLEAVKAGGGLAIVQDPSDARFPDMPASAMARVKMDHSVCIEAMGPLLAKLVSEEVVEMPELLHDDDATGNEHLVTPQQTAGEDAVVFGCPDCGGVLRQTGEGELLHYRCRVGHAYSVEALLESQSDAIENALWTAVRSMDDSADVAKRLAERAGQHSRPEWVRKYEAQSRDLLASAGVIRRLLERGRETAEA
jgi:two-component system chemotaxis response regulator CheB